MRYQPASPWGINPSPEEIALEGWVEENGPYVTLAESRPDGEDPDED